MRHLIVLLTVSLLCMVSLENTPLQSAPLRKLPVQSAAQVRPGDSNRLIQDMLWWLPEDTETVTVANHRYVFPAVRKQSAASSSTSVKAGDVIEGLPLLPLSMVRQGEMFKPLAGRVMTLALEGSRKFRAPTDLGLMPYEGCCVVVFEGIGQGTKSRAANRSQAALDLWLKKHANATKTIAGHRVAVFNDKVGQNDWRTLIVQPAPNLLLCATNEQYLETMLSRMRRRATKRALPPNLPEWENLDWDARYWSVRHYDLGQALLDPSSPVSGRRAMANLPDKQASGVVFLYNPAHSDKAIIDYFTTNPQASEQIATFWRQAYEGMGPRPRHWASRVRRTSPNVVEFSVNLTDDNSGLFGFVLMMVLGHGVFV